MNVVACPSCSKQLKYNPQQAGKQVRCPACQTVMLLPGAPNPAPPANQPVQPSPVAPQQVPTGGQQTNPLLGQTFDPLAPTNQQSFAQSPAAYPQNYSSSPQAKRTPKKKNGLNPVVLWGGIGGGVLAIAVITLILLLNQGPPSLAKVPVPEYFTKVEPTDSEKDLFDNQLVVYECDEKYLNDLNDWFNERIPKIGIWLGDPNPDAPGALFFEHRDFDADYGLHIFTQEAAEETGHGKLRIWIFFTPAAFRWGINDQDD